MLIAHGTVFGRDDTAKQAPFNFKKLLDTEIRHHITAAVRVPKTSGYVISSGPPGTSLIKASPHVARPSYFYTIGHQASLGTSSNSAAQGTRLLAGKAGKTLWTWKLWGERQLIGFHDQARGLAPRPCLPIAMEDSQRPLKDASAGSNDLRLASWR